MPAQGSAVGRRGEKSPDAFRTISEVATELELPQHVLRFWETKFSQVRPMKRGGGRRYYRPEDIALLDRIRELLYSEGYTIKGVQKLLREGSIWPSGQSPRSYVRARRETHETPFDGTRRRGLDERTRKELKALLDELIELREALRKTG